MPFQYGQKLCFCGIFVCSSLHCKKQSQLHEDFHCKKKKMPRQTRIVKLKITNAMGESFPELAGKNNSSQRI